MSRSSGRATARPARGLGELLGVPWYTNLGRLVAETSPAIGIVAVTHASNGRVGLLAVEHGLHVLLETPIAPSLAEADAIVASSSFNDFAGHGYHGVSVMRSYLIAGTNGPRKETQEHGLVEFEGGRLGVFHWTSVGYDSALRWWRSSRFLAEKGMGLTIGFGLDVEEKLSILTPDGEGPQLVTLERVWEQCDGGALTALRAHTGRAQQPVALPMAAD